MSKLTEEEENLTEYYILLEMARKVLERDLERLDQAPLKLKDPYIHLLELSLHKLSLQFYKTKKNMKKIGLKVHLTHVDQTFSEYKIFSRGYVLSTKYLNAHLKNQVSRQIEDLFTVGFGTPDTLSGCRPTSQTKQTLT
ncbi:hypothetical protein MM221_20800 [Salipaludibacillus sp. LMS25]|jgi:hypothetical protein|uniref:hypothetical protein n=1 Tax=Salipaludibacillus sp. LMS25 TaxID=2924031 RepID=UPI0020D097DC|nr:hypothetical protein [Salipaludibacillus sp. LMS25]UTR14940.1 hypothetical protein MM221_20800 [Salipaludibacillus sp. LMS25]